MSFADMPLLQRVVTLLEMIKFQHTIFALPFALLAACFAAFDGKGATTRHTAATYSPNAT